MMDSYTVYLIENTIDQEIFVKVTKSKDLRRKKWYYKNSLKNKKLKPIQKKMILLGYDKF